jgi:hypothetical protein
MTSSSIDDVFAAARIDDVVRIGDASAIPQQVIPAEGSEGAQNLFSRASI